MKVELLSVSTPQGVELDGAHYRYEEERSDRAFCLLHGKTMNFYVGMPRFLPPVLVEEGYDCLSLNRSGHGIGSIRDSFKPLGDAWTTFRQHLEDVETAVRYLKELGYQEILLAGHSLGGYLAGTYAAGDRDVKGLVLASPIGSFHLSTMPLFAPEDERVRVFEEARRLVGEGRGERMLAISEWPYLVSAETLMTNLMQQEEAPLLAESVRKVEAPTLLVFGTEGVEAQLGAEAHALLEASAAREKRLIMLRGSDHFYNGFVEEFCSAVLEWLRHVDL